MTTSNFEKHIYRAYYTRHILLIMQFLQKLPQLQHHNQLSKEPTLCELKLAIKAIRCAESCRCRWDTSRGLKYGRSKL